MIRKFLQRYADAAIQAENRKLDTRCAMLPDLEFQVDTLQAVVRGHQSSAADADKRNAELERQLERARANNAHLLQASLSREQAHEAKLAELEEQAAAIDALHETQIARLTVENQSLRNRQITMGEEHLAKAVTLEQTIASLRDALAEAQLVAPRPDGFGMTRYPLPGGDR